MADKERDVLSGTETTGHEWDGIRELNTPLPRWWLYTFYVCILWAFVYWVLYPAWPSLSGYTSGVLGYSSRAELKEDLAQQKVERSSWLSRFEQTTVAEIVADPNLLQYAMAGGKVVFGDNCAPCHGAGGQGAKEYPVLADDDWLWGGSLEAIEQSVRYGIRSGHAEARVSEMPVFGDTLDPAQTATLADYVMALAGQGAKSPEGETLFADNCAACHGETGAGMKEMGAPNLTDGIGLHAHDRAGVVAQITKPRHGVMPAWAGRLDDASIKQVTVYVHKLGGGE